MCEFIMAILVIALAGLFIGFITLVKIIIGEDEE